MTERADPEQARARVRAQYEAHPYPPPEADLGEFLRGETFLMEDPSRHFHWYWPFRARDLDLRILVAGCGTAQAAQIAACCPEARITGIDISRRSLEATEALASRHGLTNLELLELPVERAGALGGPFDLVISTGVLHHLPDPDAGLAALASVLDEAGSLYLMLYGAYGRAPVYLLQALLRRMGLGAGNVRPEDLAAVRALLGNLPETHPMRGRLEAFPDWKSDAGLVDLLLHAQDRAYTLPEVHGFLARAGLVMQRLLFRAHYSPRCSALARSAFMARIARLSPEEQYAVGELYRAGIKKHTFIACRADRDPASYRIRLDADDFQALIPARVSLLEVVGAGLPPGCRAGLRWPLHQFADIRLPLDELGFGVFREVDGERSIGAVREAARLQGPEAQVRGFLREFFAALEEYDYLWLRGA